MEKLAKYGEQFIFYIPLVTAGSTAYQSSPTLASGDVTIKKDDGSSVNLAALPTASGVDVKVIISALELQAKQIRILFEDVAGAEWESDFFVISTYGHASAQHPNIGITMRGTDDAALESTLESISGDIDEIKGTGYDTGQHSLKEIKNRIG